MECLLLFLYLLIKWFFPLKAKSNASMTLKYLHAYLNIESNLDIQLLHLCTKLNNKWHSGQTETWFDALNVFKLHFEEYLLPCYSNMHSLKRNKQLAHIYLKTIWGHIDAHRRICKVTFVLLIQLTREKIEGKSLSSSSRLN